ncbi:flagellar export protein FliJ [Heliorestis convoluta]|uniref:Flagellar FliJ protein n=1 Tax=Heliorestis convoluta TaxID=356322 RepID=A0A5Q2N1D8_9FIRM|nr:flagellar export protein FliJ [Heliorestis convoluta]QGG48171.1 flagellar export protein FliJ [Heliorestis convoluta]
MMKPFTFKLQRPLDLKEKEEAHLKSELQRQRNRVEDCQRMIEENKQAMTEALIECKKMQEPYFDVSQRLLFPYYWHRLQETEAELHQQLAQEQEKEQALQEQLMKTMRDRKVLEKLRDKHLTAYKKEALREEQIILDEIALNRFMAKDKGE